MTEDYRDFVKTMTLDEMDARRHSIASHIFDNDAQIDIAIQNGRSTIPLRLNGDRLWFEDMQLKIAIKELGGTWYEENN